MKLGDKQRRFTQCIGLLIEWAYYNDCELTFGDAYRDPRVYGEVGVKKGYSHASSVHKSRLAVDFNLFVDSKYIVDGTHPKYIELGKFWETLDDFAVWGGEWGDANHFSFAHNGVK